MNSLWFSDCFFPQYISADVPLYTTCAMPLLIVLDAVVFPSWWNWLWVAGVTGLACLFSLYSNHRCGRLEKSDSQTDYCIDGLKLGMSVLRLDCSWTVRINLEWGQWISQLLNWRKTLNHILHYITCHFKPAQWQYCINIIWFMISHFLWKTLDYHRITMCYGFEYLSTTTWHILIRIFP